MDSQIDKLPVHLRLSARALLAVMSNAPEMADVSDTEKLDLVCSAAFRTILLNHSRAPQG
jgi:hypothetical protein